MNNAKLAFETNLLKEELVIDTSVVLRKRQTELVKIIEALNAVLKVPEWKNLKELVFDQRIEKLEKELRTESLKDELRSPEIYRLQGKLEWARRYDFYKLAETYKTELDNITKKLNENVTTI